MKPRIIKLTDHRQPPPSDLIPSTLARPGCFYETPKSKQIIMCVEIPAEAYEKHFGSRIGFLHQDGRIFPYTVSKLRPISGKCHWEIYDPE